ncbi:AmmeMemoRadiSam system protein B [Thermosipho ferrireducens]|uniref:MEMO1 family protein JYK00_07855 n=1 Tax=Thermosipho ferrireducens TaxID=2571116 RepID=A0ABX7S7N6_9BACT|nr:AmmeMemoRadiSam system protein B [Thermosipho ferrireducens]QTA37637.1 AmmeMemoRadiSam system protein B [Thermosipho ferrireducens]
MIDRIPAVAGTFYPKEQFQLKALLKDFFEEKMELSFLKQNVGLILPHAGYIYSAKTAAFAISKLKDFGKPKTVILIGPNHTGIGKGTFSIWDKGKWITPFGDFAVDTKLAAFLIENNPFIVPDYSSHIAEHSLEVQIPILSYFLGSFKIVPILVNNQSYENVLKLTKTLKEIWEVEKSLLFVASSDMNHYESEDITLQKDTKLIEKILEKDIKGMYEIALKYNISACGIGPIASIIPLFENVKLIHHTTSADISGDSFHTVGYASFLLW